MARTKPCANCGHPKSHHRAYGCIHTWQARGQAFMGSNVVIKCCLCDGYVERTAP